ncbi:dimethylhistidine N-methyltransferase [Inhella inkyongensis]|uniref:Dimethylhistidine N-methyltransferase n=2 Tax=Inhella inkyongensis TaxID=392593 RepID=A0A840S1X8_9BURK|nr:L-histidine N(alpha)-methyltransferase [Inhella inkyongensis]MBB5205167.1 dimethylhistidine N-methyltransferase [Inhella inkyongensis]
MREPVFHTLSSLCPKALAAEAEAGLLAPQAHCHPKLFYDALGSHLFDAITELDEYDLRRTEAAALAMHQEALGRALRACLPQQPCLIDLGAGSCAKGEALFALCDPGRYVAVDISVDFLRRSLQCLQRAHPERELIGVGLDFSAELALPDSISQPGSLVFYPGSSIGNFDPDSARRFLGQARLLARGGALLIGVDLRKTPAEHQAAYDDALGVTAAFNLNLLRHLNRLLGADFDPHQWRHRALWNADLGRVEMHLEAQQALRVNWGGHQRGFAAGERIHTENAYKWTVPDFEALLHAVGWGQAQAWCDPEERFAVFLASE